jgi:flagellar FliL protein
MSDDAPETAAAPGGTKPILLIAAVVVGLGAGGATGAMVVGPALAAGVAPTPIEQRLHAKPAADGDAEEEGGDAGEEGDHGSDGGAAGKEGEKEGEAGGAATVHVVDNLVLNPAASGGTRFLLLTVAFDLRSAALAEQLKARDAEVRDAVLAALGAKTVEQLTDPAARETMKEELKTVVGAVLKKKKAVRRIYFPQFVIQ